MVWRSGCIPKYCSMMRHSETVLKQQRLICKISLQMKSVKFTRKQSESTPKPSVELRARWDTSARKDVVLLRRENYTKEDLSRRSAQRRRASIYDHKNNDIL